MTYQVLLLSQGDPREMEHQKLEAVPMARRQRLARRSHRERLLLVVGDGY